jgi:hypothetical protein
MNFGMVSSVRSLLSRHRGSEGGHYAGELI